MADFDQHGMTQREIDAVQRRYGKGPNLATDVVVLTARWQAHGADLRVLLIERKNKPYRGCFALPGGFVDMQEDLEPAARRELAEETGIKDLDVSFVEQLRAFGHPLRDPRSRVVSIVHLAWVPWRDLSRPRAGDDAASADYVRLRDGIARQDNGTPIALAFDHEQVLAEAWQRIQMQSRYSSMPLLLVPETFTASELRSLYQQLVGPIDSDALIAWLLRSAWIVQADDHRFRSVASHNNWARPRWLPSI